MRIKYQGETNTLHIDTKIHENEYVRKLPNRRWSNRYKAWIAPCTRLNARLILDEWEHIQNLNMDVETKNKIQQAGEGIEINRLPFPVNYNFKYKPYAHQIRALDYIYGLRYSALHVEMGLGKTKIAIDKAFCHYQEGGIDIMVVACPCSIRTTWEVAIHEHAPIDNFVIVSAELKTSQNKKDVKNLIHTKTEALKILIVGIESLSRESGEAYQYVNNLLNQGESMFIVDEAHMIKNSEALRTKNHINIGQKAKYRLTMTGTPISQGILDLYGQMQFLSSDILGVGDFYSFKRRYAIEEEHNYHIGRTIKKVVGYQNVDELMDTIKPFVFTCTKAEALDLPSKVYTKRYVELSKDQAQVYKKLKQDRYVEIQDITVDVENVLAQYTALQRVAGGYISVGTGEYGTDGIEKRELKNVVKSTNNPKLKELKEIINDLPDNEQLIIWARFRSEVRDIAKELVGHKTDKFKKSSVIFVDGDDQSRKQSIADIDNKVARYFISTQMSGGVGLTLNTVNCVVYYSNTFSYLHRVQSEDRNHRIGQNRSVSYIDIVAKATVDEEILSCLSDKKDLADYVTECLQHNKKSII